jgi:uncharacterized membrane protein
VNNVDFATVLDALFHAVEPFIAPYGILLLATLIIKKVRKM